MALSCAKWVIVEFFFHEFPIKPKKRKVDLIPPLHVMNDLPFVISPT